jgi:hypothetical protein
VGRTVYKFSFPESTRSGAKSGAKRDRKMLENRMFAPQIAEASSLVTRAMQDGRVMSNKLVPGTKMLLLVGVLASGILVIRVGAQSAAPARKPAVAAAPSRYQPNRFSRRAGMYYGLIWGVDSLAVKSVESGEVIRFTYHVLDGDKAKPLNDKKSEPFLIDPRAGIKLVVPSLENVGQLRQSGTPEAGKSYWMAFSNQGRLVKRGDRVSVVIGQFRVDGLVVQ